MMRTPGHPQTNNLPANALLDLQMSTDCPFSGEELRPGEKGGHDCPPSPIKILLSGVLMVAMTHTLGLPNGKMCMADDLFTNDSKL